MRPCNEAGDGEGEAAESAESAAAGVNIWLKHLVEIAGLGFEMDIRV